MIRCESVIMSSKSTTFHLFPNRYLKKKLFAQIEENMFDNF